MLKLLSWLIFIPFAVVVVVFAVSNRGPIPINFWPLPFEEQIPLYLISLGTLAVGAFFGGLLTWASVAKWRILASSRASDVRFQKNELERLNNKVATLEAELEKAKQEPVQEVLPAIKSDAA
jgi:uncharacterized integral membrane protein